MLPPTCRGPAIAVRIARFGRIGERMAQVIAWENVLARDRRIVAGALVAIVVLAWADLLGMGDMGASPAHWTRGYFAAMFVMWAVMMAGMMIPSAAPTILLFASLRRYAGAAAAAHAILFAMGYLALWTAFSAGATAAQWWLSERSLLSGEMSSDGPILAGALFVVAGLYQLTPLKAACLAKCRSPAQFLVERRREGASGAFVTGADHGLYCLGCCWALMALLFAFGVMNLVWVAALAAFVLLEKLLPAGPAAARVAGMAMTCLGFALLNVR